MQPPRPETPFDRLGEAFFAELAASLYAGIASDSRIRAMFPGDIGPQSASVVDMREFLIQYFGGPARYSERKGHPRLRARHMRFPIDQSARDAWLENALTALDGAAAAHRADPADHALVRRYLVEVSQFMINSA
ncbi:MAG: globin [Phycisphaerales bacterium]